VKKIENSKKFGFEGETEPEPIKSIPQPCPTPAKVVQSACQSEQISELPSVSRIIMTNPPKGKHQLEEREKRDSKIEKKLEKRDGIKKLTPIVLDKYEPKLRSMSSCSIRPLSRESRYEDAYTTWDKAYNEVKQNPLKQRSHIKPKLKENKYLQDRAKSITASPSRHTGLHPSENMHSNSNSNSQTHNLSTTTTDSQTFSQTGYSKNHNTHMNIQQNKINQLIEDRNKRNILLTDSESIPNTAANSHTHTITTTANSHSASTHHNNQQHNNQSHANSVCTSKTNSQSNLMKPVRSHHNSRASNNALMQLQNPVSSQQSYSSLSNSNSNVSLNPKIKGRRSASIRNSNTICTRNRNKSISACVSAQVSQTTATTATNSTPSICPPNNTNSLNNLKCLPDLSLNFKNLKNLHKNDNVLINNNNKINCVDKFPPGSICSNKKGQVLRKGVATNSSRVSEGICLGNVNNSNGESSVIKNEKLNTKTRRRTSSIGVEKKQENNENSSKSAIHKKEWIGKFSKKDNVYNTPNTTKQRKSSSRKCSPQNINTRMKKM
jgi:hypothetical protein